MNNKIQGKIRQLLLVSFLTIALAAPAFALDIYVDNSLAQDCIGKYSIADRNCSGSDGNAFVNPQNAADVVDPGDTIYFREGTYYNHRDLRDAAIVMNILRNGTPDNPITFKNYNNEEAIFSAIRPGDNGHFYAITLGIKPSDQKDISGQGVHDIIIEGLIVEGASNTGLAVFGPANRYASAENPTKNVTIRKVIARNNASGISTRGKVVNVTIEYCEAYNNIGAGISFGRLSKSWHEPEPEDDMSAAQNSAIRNCLSYNNINPDNPGDTDGMGGSHMYHCTIEDNVVFGNSDDGIDIYASIGVTAKSNMVFGHNYPGGNQAGIKFAAGGGGSHTIAGNTVFNNGGTTFEGSNPSNELRVYRPSRLYNNLAYNGYRGFGLGGNYYDTTYPEFEKVYLMNNIGLDNINTDISWAIDGFVNSNYNFFSKAGNLQNMQKIGQDLQSLTGDPMLANKEAVVGTNFGADWAIEQKLEYIRSQVRAAYSLESESRLIDSGTIILGYHCATPGEHPGENCNEWQGTAPDIGAFEYEETSSQCGNGTVDSGENCSNCPQDSPCPTGQTCQSGTCIAPQECVDIQALMNYISEWKQGSITMIALMQKITAWKTGEGC